MMRKRYRPTFECLEGRCVPSVTARVIGDNLYLTGAPTWTLLINESAPSVLTVTDNGHAVGTFSVFGGIIISFTKEPGDIDIDLNGNTLYGSIIVGLGNGYSGTQPSGSYSVNVYDDSLLGGGTVSGCIELLQGNGQETFNVGNYQTGNVPTADPITVLGGVTAVGTRSSFGNGNQFRLGDGSTVLGSVTLTYISQVAIGSGTGGPLASIGGCLTINNYGNLRALQAVDNGSVSGSVSITGTVLDDIFELQDTTTGGGYIGGNLTVNLESGGANGDRFSLDSGTTVDGNAYLTAGGNTNAAHGDQYQIWGTINGNLTVAMGNNTNSLFFTAQPMVGSQTPMVLGSMTVSAGNGTNYIGTSAVGEFNGTINGNLNITLGSGNNGSQGDTMVLAPMLGGTLNWHSGNGKDFVTLGDAVGLPFPYGAPSGSGQTYNYNVNFVFGSNDDTFILDIDDPTAGNPGTITGTVDGGGRITGNTYVDASPDAITTNFTMRNFP